VVDRVGGGGTAASVRSRPRMERKTCVEAATRRVRHSLSLRRKEIVAGYRFTHQVRGQIWFSGHGAFGGWRYNLRKQCMFQLLQIKTRSIFHPLEARKIRIFKPRRFVKVPGGLFFYGDAPRHPVAIGRSHNILEETVTHRRYKLNNFTFKIALFYSRVDHTIVIVLHLVTHVTFFLTRKRGST